MFEPVHPQHPHTERLVGRHQPDGFERRHRWRLRLPDKPAKELHRTRHTHAASGINQRPLGAPDQLHRGAETGAWDRHRVRHLMGAELDHRARSPAQARRLNIFGKIDHDRTGSPRAGDRKASAGRAGYRRPARPEPVLTTGIVSPSVSTSWKASVLTQRSTPAPSAPPSAPNQQRIRQARDHWSRQGQRLRCRHRPDRLPITIGR